MAQAALVGGLRSVEARDEAVAPGDEVAGMARRAGAQVIQFGGRREQRIGQPRVAIQLLVEQALADPGGRDREFARASDADDLLQHHGAVGEQRAARLRHALHVLEQGRVGALHHFEEVQFVGGLDAVAVHDVERVAPGGLVQAGERAPGAAHRVEAAPAQGLQLGRGLLQVLADDLESLLDRAAGEILEGEAAERHGHAGADRGAAHVHEFEGAATQIPHHPVGGVEAGDDAERREFGLAPARQEFDPLAAGRFRRRQELGAVLGVARGGGGQDEDP